MSDDEDKSILFSSESQTVEINDFIQSLLGHYVTTRNIVIKAQQIIVGQNMSLTVSYNLSFIAQQDIIFKKDAFVNLNGNGALYLKAGIENAEGKGKVIFEDAGHKQITVDGDAEVHIYYNPEPDPNIKDLHKYLNSYKYSKHVEPRSALKSYMLVNDVYDLQNILADLHANYALSNNIDASITKSWNEGKGFEPLTVIGFSHPLPFSGNFDGNNFQINNLYINKRENFVGLFGVITGGLSHHISIANFNLINIDIYGNVHVGGVAGMAEYADFKNIKVINSNIKGEEIVGGFAGTANNVELHNTEFNQVLDTIVTASECSGIYFGVIKESTIYDSKGYCCQIKETEQLHCNGYEAHLIWQE